MSSESRLRISEKLPVAPGASPFHVKGHVYQKMFEDFEHSVGVRALLDRVGDPAISNFASQPLLASSWYDALPLMPLSLAHARMLGLPFHQHLRDRGRWVAERDIPGIYRTLLALATPELVASRLPRASMTYFDFGNADACMLRPGLVRVAQEGVPQTLVPWIAASTEGFVSAAMEMAGGRRVVVKCVGSDRDGDKQGIPTARVELEVTWE